MQLEVDMNCNTSEISVVVCAKNAKDTLDRCLRSILQNKIKELIVIDGCSKDTTVEIARKYTQKIYSDDKRGLGYARQLGAEKAGGKYVAYVDSDTKLPDKYILTKLIQEMENNKWAAIHAQLIDPRDNKTYWEMGEDFHWKNRFNKSGNRTNLGTIVCLIRRELILRYRFDEFFKGAAEDSDFYSRILKEGYSIGVSSATAYHYHRASFSAFAKQRIWYGRGNARIIWKHHCISVLFAPLLIIIGGTIFSTFHGSVRTIPFYIIWGFFLFIGTLSGLLELCKETFS